MLDGAVTRYRLPETKLAYLWTLLTMDQHYNCCWHTSQRRVNNLRDSFKSWNGRHNPGDDVELYMNQDYPSGGTPSTPRCLTRASGLTDRCCSCKRHDALVCLVRVWEDSKRERDDRGLPIGKCHHHCNVNADTSERHSKHPSLTPI
ncbi:hypothetical protein LSAT2_007774 [Lamellibrachia satsuma]|nr:hypothetical protein LSAT2_007774 [Lamellibrachia satsuma]